MLLPVIYSLVIPYLLPSCNAACTPSSTSTEGLQSALTSGGEGYVLQLCAGETYSLQETLNYTAANQVSLNIMSGSMLADGRKSQQRDIRPMTLEL
jgi:hypothetical protein